jgi:Fe2+ transport system protein FeoA
MLARARRKEYYRELNETASHLLEHARGLCGIMQDLVPLRQLGSGQTARIGRLVGCPEHVQRMEEMGLRSGATVEMVKSGVPCIVELSGARLCFRESDSFSIFVRR